MDESNWLRASFFFLALTPCRDVFRARSRIEARKEKEKGKKKKEKRRKSGERKSRKGGITGFFAKKLNAT